MADEDQGFKLITILAPEVHDGLGGIHKVGDRVTLPNDVADLFLAKKLAVLDGVVSDSKAKELTQAAEDKVRQSDQKARAEGVMRRHDAELEKKLAAAVNNSAPRGTITGSKPRGKP